MIIVLPVAGRGRRFGAATSQRPKCVLPVRGRPMLRWALDSIHHGRDDVVAVVHEEQRDSLGGELAALVPKAQIVEQRMPLSGAADTVYQARHLWRDEEDVVVLDCDIHARSSYDRPGWQEVACDGSVLAFPCDAASKSYIEANQGRVVRIAEKEVVSDLAVGGIYHFRSGRGLESAIERLIAEGQRVRGEFYLSQAVNHYLREHPDFRVVPAERFHDLGTPDCVERFEREWDGR